MNFDEIEEHKNAARAGIYNRYSDLGRDGQLDIIASFTKGHPLCKMEDPVVLDELTIQYISAYGIHPYSDLMKPTKPVPELAISLEQRAADAIEIDRRVKGAAMEDRKEAGLKALSGAGSILQVILAPFNLLYLGIVEIFELIHRTRWWIVGGIAILVALYMISANQ